MLLANIQQNVQISKQDVGNGTVQTNLTTERKFLVVGAMSAGKKETFPVLQCLIFLLFLLSSL